jgi:O-antigen ligase
MKEKLTYFGMDQSARRVATICLALFCVLFVLVTIASPLNIFISGPSVTQREETSPVLTYIVFSISFMLLILNIVSSNMRFIKRDFFNLFILLSLQVAYVFSCVELGNGDRPSFTSMGLWALITLSAYFTFRFIQLSDEYFSWIFRYTNLFISLLVVGLSYYFVKYDMIIYATSEIFGVDRPQIGELFQSTEMSNCLACILLFTPIAWASSKRKVSKFFFVIFASIPILFLFLIMGSLGSYISILFVIIFFVPIRRSIKILITTIFLLVVTIFFLNVYFESFSFNISEFYEKIINKLLYDRRNSDYSTIWEMIKDRPFTGNGVRSVYNLIGLYPHNNILGIWAELGFIVLLAYLANLFLCVNYCFRIKKLFLCVDKDNIFINILICFSMMTLFIFLKGFVHDTWQDWNLWFYYGSMLGLASNQTDINDNFDRFE